MISVILTGKCFSVKHSCDCKHCKTAILQLAELGKRCGRITEIDVERITEIKIESVTEIENGRITEIEIERVRESKSERFTGTVSEGPSYLSLYCRYCHCYYCNF